MSEREGADPRPEGRSEEPGLGAWGEALEKHVAELRRKAPLPAVEELSVAQDFQRRINGGSLIQWLRRGAGQAFQERAVLAGPMGVEPDPILVFTSDVTGLLAAEEILADVSWPSLALLSEEYAALPGGLADKEFARHVLLHCACEELDEESLERARRVHPISEHQEYWLHVEAWWFGPLAGRWLGHLWSWDGVEPDLLEEAFERLIS